MSTVGRSFGTAASVLLGLSQFAAAAGPVLTTLHTFTTSELGAGYSPSGVLAIRDGVLYGTTLAGGAYINPTQCPTGGNNGCGTVFSLIPPALPGGAWAESVLWSFGGSSSDGNSPFGGVAVGSGGVLYGSTGAGGLGSGTVFSLTPPAAPDGAWTEQILWTFGASATDGTGPSGIVLGPHGVLYGATYAGGTFGSGTVFSLTPPPVPGGAWTENLLWSFGGATGSGTNPNIVAVNRRGVIFGSTEGAGKSNFGTIFELIPPATAGAAWREKVLYQTTDREGRPTSVVLGPRGVVYFATAGVVNSKNTAGQVSSLTPPKSPGGKWTLTPIKQFPSDGHYYGDGFGTKGLLIERTTSIIYGTAEFGGTRNAGTLYKFHPPSTPRGQWAFKKLHDFQGTDGQRPGPGLVAGKGGVLYGITEATIFSLVP